LHAGVARDLPVDENILAFTATDPGPDNDGITERVTARDAVLKSVAARSLAAARFGAECGE